MEYYSAIKSNEIVPFAETWVDLETVLQSEVSQKEKHKHHIVTHTYGIQKTGTDASICKAEIETQMQRTSVWTPRGEKEMGMNWEIGIDTYIIDTMYKIGN